jgi:SOS response regulatory protein OraA/RecX
MLIRSRLQRGQGRRRIEQELAQHAIDVGEVAEHFDEGDVSESERCYAALEKWMRSKKDPNREKAFRFLASRGFNFSDATEAVNAIFR